MKTNRDARRIGAHSRFSAKLVAAFLLAIGILLAQDPSSFLTPNVLRVGEKLACRCGGCRNTVGTCPMLHCESADPMRQRIAAMQAQGKSDDAIVSQIVREQGVVALASPPATGFGLFTWIMPGVALIVGFLIYSTWVKRNRKAPAPITPADDVLLDRYRDQIDHDLEEPGAPK